MKIYGMRLFRMILSIVMMSVFTVSMAENGNSPTPQTKLRVPRFITQQKYSPKKAYLYNDISRTLLQTDDAHRGVRQSNEVIPFTGKGVVVGIVDCGIDPRHPAFRHEETDTSRVALYITTTSAYENNNHEFSYRAFPLAGGAMIEKRFVDFSSSGHGTHTAATAAGSRCDNDYYGMAPESTLILTSLGEGIFDDEVLFGITSTLDYAKQHDMPCIVSLSLGSSAGMHDGTGYLTDALEEELADNGQIVCFAAGNDGMNPCSLHKNFDEDKIPLATVLTEYGRPVKEIATYFTSENRNLQIAFTLVQIGPDRYEEIWRSPFLRYDELNEEKTDILPSLEHISSHVTADSHIYIAPIRGVDTNVGMEISGNLSWHSDDALYTLGVVAYLPDGGEVFGFTQSTICAFRKFGVEGYTDGNPDESISDYCTSPYVISVGAVNARESYTDLYGNEYVYDTNEYGDIHTAGSYSSYGTKPDVLPHTMASGTNVISAIHERSSYTKIAQIYDKSGAKWYYGVSSGTSMSTPAIAGIIALWLQADPTLCRDDILDVLAHASDTEYGTERSRYGVPSAYEGLKYILSKQSSLLEPGIMNNDYDNFPSQVMVKYLSQFTIEAVLPFPTNGGRYTLYNTNGSILSTGDFVGNMLHIDIENLRGIGVLRITTPDGIAYQKICSY